MEEVWVWVWLFVYKQNFTNTEQASTRCAKPLPNRSTTKHTTKRRSWS